MEIFLENLAVVEFGNLQVALTKALKTRGLD